MILWLLHIHLWEAHFVRVNYYIPYNILLKNVHHSQYPDVPELCNLLLYYSTAASVPTQILWAI